MGLPPALPFAFSGAVSPGLMVSGRVILLGFSMSENSGTAGAVFNIWDGSTGGVRLFRVALNTNESTREWFGPMGIAFEQGIFMERGSGNVVGAIFCVPEVRVGDFDYLFTESTG